MLKVGYLSTLREKLRINERYGTFIIVLITMSEVVITMSNSSGGESSTDEVVEVCPKLEHRLMCVQRRVDVFVGG